jgi:KDO2-lipid IV(A) lauroyltransferase
MFRWFTSKLAHLGTWCGFEIGCAIAKGFPRTVFWLSDALAQIGHCGFRSFRNRSVGNLRAALGDDIDDSAIDAMVHRTLRNFFRGCAEILIVLKSSDNEIKARIPILGRENLDAALAKGRGVVVLSAHLGNFFLLGGRLSLEGYETFVLVNQPRDGRFADMMERYRRQVRQRSIHARPRREALRELNGVLRRNQLAVLIADEFRRASGIETPFFGGMVISRRGPATLALRTGAAVVPACLVRQPDDSLKLMIEPELELERSGPVVEQVRVSTIRITQWLERTVRRYPDQWNWMNVRWWVEKSEKIVSQQERIRRAV